jgi:hypothetical protein
MLNESQETEQPTITASSATNPSARDKLFMALGIERRKSDMRQLGALLVILGMGAAYSALAFLSILVDGMTGVRHVEEFRLPALVATVVQTSIGMTAMVIGFVTLIATPLTKRAHVWAKILVAVVNIGPVSFIITVVKLIQGASQPPEENDFIPLILSPTQTDIRFAVAMGILALVSVCATLIGGLTVVGLSLCAYLGGQQVDKHQGYYIVRFAYYNLLVFIGGISQLMLGMYLWVRFGCGPYEEPVHVTTYTIFFPWMTCFVGAAQTSMGIYGWSRALRWSNTRDKDDHRFMYTTLSTWIVTMIFQIIVQPSYGDGTSYDAEGATYAAVYIGFFVMPAWLDHMVRHTPPRIDPSHFALPPCTQCKEDAFCKLFGLTESQFFVVEEGQKRDVLEFEA